MVRLRRPTRREHNVRTIRSGVRVGFTLIEILVVLALIVVLGAIAVPSITPISDRAIFDEATEMIRSAGVVARSEAQTRGDPLELVVVPNSVGGQRLLLRQFARAESAEGREVSRRTIAELGALGTGVRISASGAAEATPESAEAAARGGEELAASESADEEVLELSLGVYWPGGGAETSGSWVLIAGDSREFTGKLNPWTGAITLSERPRAADQRESPSGEPLTEPASDPASDEEVER